MELNNNKDFGFIIQKAVCCGLTGMLLDKYLINQFCKKALKGPIKIPGFDIEKDNISFKFGGALALGVLVGEPIGAQLYKYRDPDPHKDFGITIAESAIDVTMATIFYTGYKALVNKKTPEIADLKMWFVLWYPLLSGTAANAFLMKLENR